MDLSLSDFLIEDDFKFNSIKTFDQRKTIRSKQKFNYYLVEVSLKKFLSDSTKTPMSISAIARQLRHHRRMEL